MPKSKVPSEYIFLWRGEVLVSLVSDTNSAFQCLYLLLSLVREIIFMIWKVVLWIILDIKILKRIGVLTTWLVLLQSKLHITILSTMKMSYEGKLLSFWCVNALWGNDAQILWYPRNITCLIPERNHTSTFSSDRILNNPKSRNLKTFCYAFELSWEIILFKLHKVSLVGRTWLSSSSVKYDWNWAHHAHEVWVD